MPDRRRKLVRSLRERYRISERRGCSVLQIDQSSHRYRSNRDDQTYFRSRIREIAPARVRISHRRIHIVLRREGIVVTTRASAGYIARKA